MLGDAVEREFRSLPASLQSALLRLAETIESFGPEGLHGQYVKHVEGKLWELRVKAEQGIARAFYVTVPERRVVVLRIFVKTPQKTPRTELALARQRMKQV